MNPYSEVFGREVSLFHQNIDLVRISHICNIILNICMRRHDGNGKYMLYKHLMNIPTSIGESFSHVYNELQDRKIFLETNVIIMQYHTRGHRSIILMSLCYVDV